MSSKKLLSVEPPAGRVLKEGKLKRSVKKLFGTSLVSAHVVLTSDPILCVYDDEQKAKLKASYKLAKGTTIHCQVATDIIVSIPTSDSKKESVTFKSDDVAESMAWRTALSNDDSAGVWTLPAGLAFTKQTNAPRKVAGNPEGRHQKRDAR